MNMNLTQSDTRKARAEKLSSLEALLCDELEPLFARPDLLDKPSAWFGHIPFAHWIIKVTRPRILVELGTHAGVSYSAFCAAVIKEKTQTRCYSVDTWTGDEHAGRYGSEIFDDLKNFNDERYSHFSTLLRCTFDEAIDHFPDNSIDVLHIDGFHTSEAVNHDFSFWQLKLSDRAVVLFHDTNEYRKDFGVWRFWAEMRERYPSFEFLHSHGLGVLAVGDHVPSAIAELCSLDDDEKVSAIRNRFQAFGSLWATEAKTIKEKNDHLNRIKRIEEKKACEIERVKADAAKRISEKDAEIQRRILEKDAEIQRLKERVTLTENRVVCLEQENKAILSSTSWRLTKPLRTVADRIPNPVRSQLMRLFRIFRLATNPMTWKLRLKQWRVYKVLSLSPLFDRNWYLSQYPDVAAVGFDPVRHYVEHGTSEGRNPSDSFETRFYLERYPDVQAAGINPLFHYVTAGKSEGRLVNMFELVYETISQSPLFDREWYLAQYPDVAAAGLDPVWHYIEHGASEGRNPSDSFETRFYLEHYPDALAAGINPLFHYVTAGQLEGRTTKSDWFLESMYDSSRLLTELNQAGQIVAPETLPCLITLALTSIKQRPLRVSVIIATWNRESVVAEAIRSALAQSYSPLEVIVVDDGSDDNTCNVIEKSFANELHEGKIKYIFIPHTGVSAARNQGLHAASGDLIAYLDSDNLWHKHYLLFMTAVFAENNAICSAYCGQTRHNINSKSSEVLLSRYNRKELLQGNFIDLNCFMHRRRIFEQLGGFDERLKRLVDWELILRYTRLYPPAYISVILVDYYINHKLANQITFSQELKPNKDLIDQLNRLEHLQRGIDILRIGYFIYDFPALSQTFVMSELRWLWQKGFDVVIYFAVDPDKPCKVDFDIPTYRVKDSDHLAELLVAHQRTLCHTHFAAPGLPRFLYPACKKLGIPFTFMPHAVDIFAHSNRETNRISEISRDPLCKRVFVHGDFHRKYLQECGVPSEKISYNFQAVDTKELAAGFSHTKIAAAPDWGRKTVRGLVIARFIEKKGIEVLIRAAASLRDIGVVFDVHGYGPLESRYRELITELGVTNIVNIKEPINDPEALKTAYRKCDFLIAPCVTAANGDMDGFPTVIIEAMAAGKPVVASAISAIPDYLADGINAVLTPPGDAIALSGAIRRLVAMSPARRSAMCRRAREFLAGTVGTEKTMTVLLDEWLSRVIDIVLVTFNRKDCDDRESTFEIIDRVLTRTTTPFTLTIVDNASDKDFTAELKARIAGRRNVRLLLMDENLFVGPATNLAMAHGEGEFVIYLCAKEGFVKQHGWERKLVDYMRAHPKVAIAGHPAVIPKHVTGAEYQRLPWFADFRNSEFAEQNPVRKFRHIQGGVFIARRKVLLKHGGFSERVPHNGTDIEISFFLESLGYELGFLPEIASVTVKTVPGLRAFIDEKTVVAHPLNVATVRDELDRINPSESRRCNICGWFGTVTTIEAFTCPNCNSTAFGRSVYRLLADNWRLHRRACSAALTEDKALENALHGWFSKAMVSENADLFDTDVLGMNNTFQCIVVDSRLAGDGRQAIVNLKKWIKCLATDGVLFASEPIEPHELLFDSREFQEFVGEGKLQSLTSAVVEFDWRRFWVYENRSAKVQVNARRSP